MTLSRRDLGLIRRASKSRLLEICETLGITFHPSFARDQLIAKIESWFDVPETVFGHSAVVVEKNAAFKLWEVSSPQGVVLLHVPWRLVFTFREELASSPTRLDIYAALEACLSAEPLSEEDKEQLFRLHPDLRGKTPYPVDDTDGFWEVGSESAATPRSREREDPAPVPVPGPEPETRQLSLNRKISI